MEPTGEKAPGFWQACVVAKLLSGALRHGIVDSLYHKLGQFRASNLECHTPWRRDRLSVIPGSPPNGIPTRLDCCNWIVVESGTVEDSECELANITDHCSPAVDADGDVHTDGGGRLALSRAHRPGECVLGLRL
jgi:hypothetical protein